MFPHSTNSSTQQTKEPAVKFKEAAILESTRADVAWCNNKRRSEMCGCDPATRVSGFLSFILHSHPIPFPVRSPILEIYLLLYYFLSILKTHFPLPAKDAEEGGFNLRLSWYLCKSRYWANRCEHLAAEISTFENKQKTLAQQWRERKYIPDSFASWRYSALLLYTIIIIIWPVSGQSSEPRSELTSGRYSHHLHGCACPVRAV